MQPKEVKIVSRKARYSSQSTAASTSNTWKTIVSKTTDEYRRKVLLGHQRFADGALAPGLALVVRFANELL